MLSEKVLGLRQEKKKKKEYQINFDSVEFCRVHTVAVLVGADLSPHTPLISMWENAVGCTEMNFRAAHNWLAPPWPRPYNLLD